MLTQPAANYKQALVEPGIYAIEHDEWEMALAISRLVMQRWAHE
jgi:hypothetical protein